MYKNFFNESVDKLDIQCNILNKLYNNKLCTINDLWIINRKELKKYNFSDNEINEIKIKMQLLGIDINKKIYSKN